MRILILSQYALPEPGAAQIRLAAMARELVKLGNQVEVVTALPNYPLAKIYPGYEGCFYRREELHGIPHHRVWLFASSGARISRILEYLSFAFTCIFGMIRVERPDYLFVESPPLFLAMPAWVFSKIWRVPMIFNISDLWPDSIVDMGVMTDNAFVRLARRLEAWAYKKTTYVCAVTEDIRISLIKDKHVPPEKVLYLPNGVDTDLFRHLPPDFELTRMLGLENKQIVLYAGTHSLAHNLAAILGAAKHLLVNPRIHFLFVGGGSAKRDLVSLARTMGLTNVTFHDPVPPEEVSRYYSIAMCGIVSLMPVELFESARPAKALAVMACGKPLLFCAAHGSADFVRNANAGIVVDSTDEEAIADAIHTLATNQTLAEDYGRCGRRYVEENLRWTILVRNWFDQLVPATYDPEHAKTW